MVDGIMIFWTIVAISKLSHTLQLSEISGKKNKQTT